MVSASPVLGLVDSFRLPRHDTMSYAIRNIDTMPYTIKDITIMPIISIVILVSIPFVE